MKHGSICSGFGGFDLAAEWMGWENVFHCEIKEFCRNILDYYWPNADSLIDLKKTDFKKYANRIDILTGGIPCQPFSSSGKREGSNDDRHLWPEMLRAVREIKPKIVVVENVRGLINWSKGMVFKEIQADLEAEGYEVQPVLLPAGGISADHQRYRVWIVANSCSMGWKDVQDDIGICKKESHNSKRFRTKNEWRKQEAIKLGSPGNPFLWFEKNYGQPSIFSLDDGLPFELDGITVSKWIEETMTASGNAIVPQVALQIFKAIEQYKLISQNQ